MTHARTEGLANGRAKGSNVGNVKDARAAGLEREGKTEGWRKELRKWDDAYGSG